MKTCLLLFISICLLQSCKNNTEPVSNSNNTENTDKPLSLEGTWEIISFLNYRGNGVVDTIKSSADTKQIKMYSATKVMWNRLRKSDSTEWFGYGDYKVENGQLIETLEYGSRSMNITEDTNEFVFDILIEKDSFTQIQMDSEGQPIFAENYKRLE
ncbi:hypothetical protein [Hwangdonia lutea]|uniref:Lipocalin-like domain-containing protein n=1 Tax=Hwangdonia lutea TaxID=3075823 RepID=A0AA97EN84_9FLAO|nr:hypothetical protein [Hwangdonia sp. SCSIO 19198]WOD44046.1 hypothetical protein RNZ46_02010 [Hwangdonia sp. SCSIO 19198]